MGENMSDEKRICLNRSVLDFMESKLTPESLVLEFGGGWSSRWFAHRCGELIVIETSSKWARLIHADLGVTRGRCRIVVPRVGMNYAIDLNQRLSGVKADLVLIDCVENLRLAATMFAWPLLKPGGWLLFDDAQRPQHKGSIEWLNKMASTPRQLVWQPGDIETATDRLTLAWVKI